MAMDHEAGHHHGPKHLVHRYDHSRSFSWMLTPPFSHAHEESIPGTVNLQAVGKVFQCMCCESVDLTSQRAMIPVMAKLCFPYRQKTPMIHCSGATSRRP